MSARVKSPFDALNWHAASVVRGLIAIVLIAFAALAQAGVDITDGRGQRVRFEQSPQRIVTLLPSLAETVCELGQCQRLVGTDRYANHPARVAALPKLGGGLDPDIEAVVALKPDLVLLATSSRASERLQSLGLKVVALEPKTHADVRRVLDTVALILGVGDAPRVWQAIERGVDEAARSVPAAARGQRAYVEVSSAPHAASEASFIGETLARLGLRNVVPGSMGPFPKLNPEYVVQARPDIIMVADEQAADLAQRPGWSGLRAVRERRVCHFSAQQSDLLVRAGPRMAEAAQIMARCLALQASQARP